MIKFAKNPLVFEIPQANMSMGQPSEFELPHVIQLKPQLNQKIDEASAHAEPQSQGDPDALPEQSMGDGNARLHFHPSSPALGDATNNNSPQSKEIPKSETEQVAEGVYEDAPKFFVQTPDQELHDEEKDEPVSTKSDPHVLNKEDVAPALQGEVTDAKSLLIENSDIAEFAPTTGEEFLGMFAVVVPDLPQEPEEDSDLPEFMDCFF